MTTAIPLTLHLLVLIGLYELAAGIAGLTGRLDWSQMFEEFERSPSLSFVTGFMVFVIGGVMIMSHHHWTDPLAIVVSLVAWIALIEGLLIMIVAQPLLIFFRPVLGSQRAISAFAALFGIVLIVLGLTGRADPTAL
ncbi:DUF2065 domain-containing protein [Sphingomonas hankyongi]|uniref:DUF2065 domain-containing protein n=1 Tax=Sphingomonas hankyongi TaxID=2908209 RepID=A0ABT0S5R7_9SPHN|nr:DUF2065 domain-containing protein [Sphingomonas hankyongi]MCL6730984.1 DUF2065 domain-containing protein [Sphingomonas hankyongi]